MHKPVPQTPNPGAQRAYQPFTQNNQPLNQHFKQAILPPSCNQIHLVMQISKNIYSLFTILIIALCGACAVDDDTIPMDDPNPSTGQIIQVRGTGGNANLIGNCEGSVVNNLRCLSVNVPASWEIVGQGGSADTPVLSEVLFEIIEDELTMSLEVHNKMELSNNLYPDAGLINEDASFLETITFGDRSFDVYKDGESWVAFIPTVTYKDWNIPQETGEVYANLRFGGTILGDPSLVSANDVLDIFRSATTPECMGDYYAQLFLESTIEYIPK